MALHFPAFHCLQDRVEMLTALNQAVNMLMIMPRQRLEVGHPLESMQCLQMYLE